MTSAASVLVVGGGAAGLMAALAAADRGARVTVLDRMDKPGRKILLTGNGRCNITNTRPHPSRYHGAPADFVQAVLRQFPPAKTMAFFNSLGLPCREEEEGRVYPACGQALAVRSVLLYELDRRDIRVCAGAQVHRLARRGSVFQAQAADGRLWQADRVIVATGGLAAPHLGSDGSGFELLKALGHRVTALFPALAPFKSRAPFLKEVDGVRFFGAAALVRGGHLLRRDTGEIQLSDDGVSGIPVLNISRAAAECGRNDPPVELRLCLLPDQSPRDIARDVQQRLSTRPQETVERALTGLIHSKLVPVLLKLAGWPNRHVPCQTANPSHARRLAELLSCWVVPVEGAHPWERAQVTAGGVPADELNPATLESAIVPGLHLAGEVVDVDGDCGGHNLQWAWSSGHAAGHHAASPGSWK